jgi:hypothetical protein
MLGKVKDLGAEAGQMSTLILLTITDLERPETAQALPLAAPSSDRRGLIANPSG